jgi:hypothetical protein
MRLLIGSYREPSKHMESAFRELRSSDERSDEVCRGYKVYNRGNHEIPHFSWLRVSLGGVMLVVVSVRSGQNDHYQSLTVPRGTINGPCF